MAITETFVKNLWVLDPRAKLLECFALLAGKWLLQGVFQANDVVSAKPFEELRYSLGQLWPSDPMPNPGFSE